MRVPYVSKGDIDELVARCREQFRFFDKEGVTVCLLTLPSGFNLIGESACPDPKRYDRERGKSESKRRAIDRLWQLERYRRSTEEISNGD